MNPQADPLDAKRGRPPIAAPPSHPAARSPRLGNGRRHRYEVKYKPPPWKCSLTESGMARKTTALDIAVVVVFGAAFLALLVWIALGG